MRRMRHAFGTVRVVFHSLAIILTESLIFGLAVLPAFAFWQFIVSLRTWPTEYLNVLVIAVTILPSYFVFCLALMAITAAATTAFRWRAPLGEIPIKGYPPAFVRWIKYNVATHIVRIFAGEVLRATPIWRWFCRANGMQIGRDVHINTAAIYDMNLIRMEDGVVIGGKAQIVAHTVEGGRLKTARVVFRKNATIGTHSIVTPGVEVGEGGRIGALSFVTKGTKIPPRTAYGGVPARLIKTYDEADPADVSAEEWLFREA